MKHKTIDAIKKILGENTYEQMIDFDIPFRRILEEAILKDYVKIQEDWNGVYRAEEFSLYWHSTILRKAIKNLNKTGIVQEEYEEFGD